MLHGFWAACGKSTAVPESKLLQQLTSVRDAILFGVFLDLHKSYDALDKGRCLEILEGYEVGTQAIRLLHKY